MRSEAVRLPVTPKSPFARAVLETLRRRGLAAPSDVVLAGLSAGPDSTAMVAVLSELRNHGHLAGVRALHVDHGLRAGGEADAACARETCERLGVPFRSVKVVVGTGNVQAAARTARYAAFRAEAARTDATRIATGHTRTDQAETVLMRLLRGAGALGLSAIPPRRGMVVRPLIDRSRSEGIRYLAEVGLDFRDDPTNATPRFLRNRVRALLWPEILALAPRAEAALARTADLARDDERALASFARRKSPKGLTSIPAKKLVGLPLAVQRRVVRQLWRSLGRADALSASHVEAVLGLVGPGRSRKVALPMGLEARFSGGALELGPRRSATMPLPPVEVAGPGRVSLKSFEVMVEVRNADAVPWPLSLRGRLPGDRFCPDGGAGSKKLKAWLIDRKVPREKREGLVLLASGQSVLAIPELGVVAKGYGPSGAGLSVKFL